MAQRAAALLAALDSARLGAGCSAQFQSEVAGFGLLSLQRVFVAQGSTEAGRLLVAHCI